MRSFIPNKQILIILYHWSSLSHSGENFEEKSEISANKQHLTLIAISVFFCHLVNGRCLSWEIMGKERESRTLLLLLRAVLIFSLLISGIVKEVGGEEIYIATTGIDELTCGSSTLPCATLLYVFSGSFPSLTDNSIIYLSPGSYNIQNLLLFPNNLTLTSTFPPLDGLFSLLSFSLYIINSIYYSYYCFFLLFFRRYLLHKISLNDKIIKKWKQKGRWS